MSNWLVMLISHCLAVSKSEKPTLHEPSTIYTRSFTAVLQPVYRSMHTHTQMHMLTQ